MRKIVYPVFFVPTNKTLFDRVIELRTEGTELSLGKKRVQRLFDLYTLLLQDEVEWTSFGVGFVREVIEAYKDADEDIIRKDLNLLVKLGFVMKANRCQDDNPFKFMADIFGEN